MVVWCFWDQVGKGGLGARKHSVPVIIIHWSLSAFESQRIVALHDRHFLPEEEQRCYIMYIEARTVNIAVLTGFPWRMIDPLAMQGFWPDGLYTQATDDALIFDLEFTKEMGFNMLRKHTKVESDRWSVPPPPRAWSLPPIQKTGL